MPASRSLAASPRYHVQRGERTPAKRPKEDVLGCEFLFSLSKRHTPYQQRQLVCCLILPDDRSSQNLDKNY